MAFTRGSTRARAAPVVAFVSTAAPNRAPSPSCASRLPERLSRQRRRLMRQLCKGNVAVVKAAVMAGCRAYYGYPITPASEIAEYAALYIPQVGGTFVQAESEVASINMVYGAAST